MGKISDFFDKIKAVKHIEIFACCAALALVLTVYYSFTSCSGSADAVLTDEITVSGSDYCAAMQAQVENIVSKISGVGSASVVINWDKSVSVGAFGGDYTNPKPIGVLVVCDGGKNTKVKLDVIYAVSTLLDMSIERIMVYPKSN